MKHLMMAVMLVAVWAIPAWAQSVAEKEILAMEAEWNTANMKHDIAFYEKLLANEFVSINEKGKMIARTEWLANARKNSRRMENIQATEEKVRVYGDLGIYTCLYEFDQISKGRKSHQTARCMDVLIKRDGRWRCVSTMGSEIKPRK